MITLTPWLEAELERRAAAEAPEECCGLIGSKDGKIGLWAAENAARDPLHSFAIAPEWQFGILKEMKQRGEELVGVYHSHPHSGPEPSKLDRAIAATMADFFPGLTWVIIGFDPCPHCDGGVVDGVEPECCGNTTTSGECRGDCAVPCQTEEQCSACGCGEGHGGPRFFSGVLA